MNLVSVADDARIRALAHEIQERPRYKNFRPTDFDVLRHLAEAWRAVMSWLRDLHDTDPQLYWVVLLTLLAVCILMLVHIVRSLREAMRVKPPPPASAALVRERDFAGEARELAAEGQHLEAAHRMLLSCLRMLASRRHIVLHPDDGNRSVCRKLGHSELPPALRDELAGLILATDGAWFGAGRADDVDSVALYERWHAALHALSKVGAA